MHLPIVTATDTASVDSFDAVLKLDDIISYH
jgi:hypothetical protein